MTSSFRGVFPAMLTPMTADENVDHSKLESLTHYLIEAGVHGLIPLGSTGEFYALAREERTAVLKTVVQAAGGRVPVVAGVNAGATREVVQYSREAEALGAAGLLVAPPYYSLPRPDEILEHMRLVDRAVGIPIMLYNFPGRTGVDMKPEFLQRLAELKNVRYVKEEHRGNGADQRNHPSLRRPLAGLLRLRQRGAGELRPWRGWLGGGNRQHFRGRARATVRVPAMPRLRAGP